MGNSSKWRWIRYAPPPADRPPEAASAEEAAEEEEEEEEELCAAHTDGGLLTITPASTVRGLELRSAGGDDATRSERCMRRPQDRATFLSDRPWKEFAAYSVPAAIYACTNNLGFLALLALHPATTTIIGQSKIIFTGLLFRQMLKRRLSAWQWLAAGVI